MNTMNQNLEVEAFPWSKLENEKVKFRVLTDNMNSGRIDDSPKGSILVTEKINFQDWETELQPNKYGYVISDNKNLHKDIVSYDPDTKSAICRSRIKDKNPPFYISLKGADVFKVTARSY